MQCIFKASYVQKLSVIKLYLVSFIHNNTIFLFAECAQQLALQRNNERSISVLIL